MYNRKKKVIVIGFNKENGGGAHEDVACTLTVGGNAGVVISPASESSTINAGKKKVSAESDCNCWVMSVGSEVK